MDCDLDAWMWVTESQGQRKGSNASQQAKAHHSPPPTIHPLAQPYVHQVALYGDHCSVGADLGPSEPRE